MTLVIRKRITCTFFTTPAFAFFKRGRVRPLSSRCQGRSAWGMNTKRFSLALAGAVNSMNTVEIIAAHTTPSGRICCINHPISGDTK